MNLTTWFVKTYACIRDMRSKAMLSEVTARMARNELNVLSCQRKRSTGRFLGVVCGCVEKSCNDCLHPSYDNADPIHGAGVCRRRRL